MLPDIGGCWPQLGCPVFAGLVNKDEALALSQKSKKANSAEHEPNPVHLNTQAAIVKPAASIPNLAPPLVLKPTPGLLASDQLTIQIRGRKLNSKHYEIEIEHEMGAWQKVYQRSLAVDSRGNAHFEIRLSQLATSAANKRWRLRTRGISLDTSWSDWVYFYHRSLARPAVQGNQQAITPQVPSRTQSRNAIESQPESRSTGRLKLPIRTAE